MEAWGIQSFPLAEVYAPLSGNESLDQISLPTPGYLTAIWWCCPLVINEENTQVTRWEWEHFLEKRKSVQIWKWQIAADFYASSGFCCCCSRDSPQWFIHCPEGYQRQTCENTQEIVSGFGTVLLETKHIFWRCKHISPDMICHSWPGACFLNKTFIQKWAHFMYKAMDGLLQDLRFFV